MTVVRPLARSLVRLALASTLSLAACNESTTPAPIVSALGSSAILPDRRRQRADAAGAAPPGAHRRHACCSRCSRTAPTATCSACSAPTTTAGAFSASAASRTRRSIATRPTSSSSARTWRSSTRTKGPTLVGSTAHDVYFQWWRHRSGDLVARSGGADVRLDVERERRTTAPSWRSTRSGALWVQAFYLESDGSATAYAARLDGRRRASFAGSRPRAPGVSRRRAPAQPRVAHGVRVRRARRRHERGALPHARRLGGARHLERRSRWRSARASTTARR